MSWNFKIGAMHVISFTKLPLSSSDVEKIGEPRDEANLALACACTWSWANSHSWGDDTSMKNMFYNYVVKLTLVWLVYIILYHGKPYKSKAPKGQSTIKNPRFPGVYSCCSGAIAWFRNSLRLAKKTQKKLLSVPGRLRATSTSDR